MDRADTNDGVPWSEMDVQDLRDFAGSGWSLEQLAGYLCRKGTVEDVASKAAELGITFKPGVARVIPWELDQGEYGVELTRADGTKHGYVVGTKADAVSEAERLNHQHDGKGRA